MRRATWGKQLTATPFFHVSGSLFNFVTVAALTSHCILPKFSPHDYLQAIQEMHPNASMLVPSMVNALLNYPDVAEYELSSMLMVMVGGAVLSPATLERAGQLFLNCDFVNTYGMTETAGGVTFMYPDLPAIEKTKRPASIGLPVHTGEIQIVNAAGETLAPGETGEIVIRAKNVMQGYWQQPEKTAEALRGGWLHSGDTGYMDEDGFLFVVDRLKDMIITGGENVYPAEVENVLFTHPAIANCAVIGLPDEQWGERVHAVIIPGDGMKIDTATIIAHCRQFIAGYKCPRSVDIRTDALPMSGAGKVLKHILRDEYEQVSPQPPEPPPY
ncbi:MAG: class I adenylate-forming enzyme family protein, partial [Aggregatilineales bacterium]